MAEQGQPQTTIRELRTSLVATTAVVITILLAIFLAAADSLQERLPVPIRPEATTMVADVVETATPAPAVTLPGPTPSPTASPSPAQTPTATATSSSIVASSGCGFIPAGWVPYVVRRGDTLFHLSITSGATINEITQANCLGMSVLTAGTVIYLPYAPPSRPACGPPQWWVRYTVQRGDTLYSLARQRGTTVYEIMQANCLVSVYIQAGRQIFLPPLPAEPSTATATLPPPTSPPPTAPPPTATDVPPPPATATASATPTATSSPPPTPPPGPTDTPQPTPSATASPTTAPTASPTASSTPVPTATATPPATPTSTNTPTPSPSDTPPPTATPTPTDTPVP
jgi:LysM repeat protein